MLDCVYESNNESTLDICESVTLVAQLGDLDDSLFALTHRWILVSFRMFELYETQEGDEVNPIHTLGGAPFQLDPPECEWTETNHTEGWQPICEWSGLIRS